MQTLRFMTFVIGACGILMASCGQKEEKKTFVIGFSQCCNDPWRDIMNEEMNRELSLQQNMRLEFRVSQNNSDLQLQHLEELVALGIDLLIVAPNEYEPLTEAIDQIYDSGIPVIMIDRKASSEKYTAYIGGGNEQIGATAADYIALRTSGVGKIIELRMAMSISPARERSDGFRRTITKYPSLEIVDSIVVEWDTLRMNTQFPEVLVRNPDATIIFSHTDLMAEIAYRMASEMGRANDLFFVGVDGIPGTGKGIQAVEDSILDASLLYPTGGAEAIKLASKILHGEPVERMNILQTTVIDRSNASILHAQMRKQASLQDDIDHQIERIDSLNAVYRNQRIFILILIISLGLTILMGGILWFSLKTKQKINQSLAKKNEEVLLQQDRLLQISNELTAANNARVNFFTNISHEFRTPLTLILGFAEDLLPSNHLNKKIAHHLQLIGNNATRLLRLVNQLMDFRKTESDQMHVSATEQDLNVFVRDVMDSFSSIAQKRHIDFKLITSHPQTMLWFDVDMVDKILFNLLSNAFKFTPDGGRIHILIEQDQRSHTTSLIIDDSGSGMNEVDQKHIFDPFYQGSNHHLSGTGIGLSLSKSLVELLKGKISVTSTLGHGTRFQVEFQNGSAHFDPSQLGGPNSSHHTDWIVRQWEEQAEVFLAETERKATTKYEQKILIIEDNPDLQYFLQTGLSHLYETLTTSDGVSGLNLAFEHLPDLIICDVMLPGRDGYRLVETLKNDLRTSHIPVILLTAKATIDEMIVGTQLGADEYITKPFHFLFLKEKIKSLLLNQERIRKSTSMSLVSFEPSDQLSSLDQAFSRKLLEVIRSNFHQPSFQLSDVCEEMKLSRSQLYRKVKSLFGKTVTDLIQESRLERAKQLLAEQEMGIADIAYEVGYSSPDYFSTVFKSYFGVAPSQYHK
ncbi:MAG: substrate-binding domain-containing protein [Bacteroidia bacterium]|nr:substrate-binding domain-containing protein [Bacteroidia bacterium]